MSPTTGLSYALFLLLAFVIIGRPQDIFPFLQPLRLGLTLSLVSLLMALFQTRSLFEGYLESPIGKRYLSFFAVMILGIPFALYSRAAFNFIFFKYAVNILFFGLFIVHVQTYERMRSMVLTIVCALCFYGLTSFIAGVSQGGRYSFGSMYDPNDLAYLFVSLAPFTALYLRKDERVSLQLLALFTLAVSLLVIVSTGSRGGLIGLVILVYLFVFSQLSPLRRTAKIVLLMGILIFAAAKRDMIFTERNATMLNLRQDYNVFSEEGRLNLWKTGVKITLANPLTGVGAMCFPEAIALDRRERNIAEKWQPAHNAFIQISSELGLVAFIIFAIIIRDTYRSFRKAGRKQVGENAVPGLQRLAGVAQIGFIGHLIVAFFLTQGYSILFTLFFAFAAVMYRPLDGT